MCMGSCCSPYTREDVDDDEKGEASGHGLSKKAGQVREQDGGVSEDDEDEENDTCKEQEDARHEHLFHSETNSNLGAPASPAPP
jgi:hypothetical protein